ncbi:RHS repeat-associated core domain-containing protein, partial [Herbivorax sp. ANBcel31]|uniref:RHS repeat domain-containing protein n=1 Tax=Herbivorax sp. ANBcel31 TaxID=3069754 RepID=UPI0027AE0D5E
YEYDKVVLEVVIKPGQDDKLNRNLYGTNLLMRQADGLTLYYMYNGHADVTALIDTNGVVRATYYYDAFGNVMDEQYFTASGNPTSTPINNSIMYAGYQYDRETGLYYLNARMYDPAIARFLQEDTYRGDPNDPLTLNLYAYTANNPITYWDPTGHSYIEIGPLYLANPIKGFRILSNSEEREKAYALIEEHGDLGFVGKRVYSLAAGYGEFSVGMIEFGMDILDAGHDNHRSFMLSTDRQLGYIDDDLYEMKMREIEKKFERRREMLKNAPKEIYHGITESAGNVFNKENAYNFFINPDTPFDELVDYSRDTTRTALAVYSGGKLLKSGHDFIKGISIETTPSAVTPFGEVLPTVPSIAIDAGLGNFVESLGFFGGVHFATNNNIGGNHWSKIKSENLDWTNHGYKHFPQKNMRWKEVVRSTKKGPAKYKHEIKIEQFERMAWDNGIPVTSGKTWKVYKADHIVGAKQGIETPYIRVELSSNTIHGHPITPQEFLDLVR